MVVWGLFQKVMVLHWHNYAKNRFASSASRAREMIKSLPIPEQFAGDYMKIVSRHMCVKKKNIFDQRKAIGVGEGSQKLEYFVMETILFNAKSWFSLISENPVHVWRKI